MEIQKLKNPSNDANAISDSLIRLGFTVTKLVNANLNEMEDAVVKLGDNLSTSNSSIGFFYYAGHGIQSNNENFIIPVDGHIPSEYFLKTKALSVQEVLDTLQGAKNKLNIIVLDACRDNPFSWSRSTTRGLTVTGAQPASSIIVYATSAGSVALDGEGKNGIFTTELLKNLEVPDLDVKDIFERTGAQVQNITNGKQIPAIHSQFFGSAILTSNATDINSNSSSKIETLLSDDDIKVIKTGNASQVRLCFQIKLNRNSKAKMVLLLFIIQLRLIQILA